MIEKTTCIQTISALLLAAWMVGPAGAQSRDCQLAEPLSDGQTVTARVIELQVLSPSVVILESERGARAEELPCGPGAGALVLEDRSGRSVLAFREAGIHTFRLRLGDEVGTLAPPRISMARIEAQVRHETFFAGTPDRPIRLEQTEIHAAGMRARGRAKEEVVTDPDPLFAGPRLLATHFELWEDRGEGFPGRGSWLGAFTLSALVGDADRSLARRAALDPSSLLTARIFQAGPPGAHGARSKEEVVTDPDPTQKEEVVTDPDPT
ncbi:MAG: hypothetical protein MI919_21960, partial [Holophagales bacterium]|nr:hypothetical protein [Holophagales bacterium]